MEGACTASKNEVKDEDDEEEEDIMLMGKNR